MPVEMKEWRGEGGGGEAENRGEWQWPLVSQVEKEYNHKQTDFNTNFGIM